MEGKLGLKERQPVERHWQNIQQVWGFLSDSGAVSKFRQFDQQVKWRGLDSLLETTIMTPYDEEIKTYVRQNPALIAAQIKKSAEVNAPSVGMRFEYNISEMLPLRSRSTGVRRQKSCDVLEIVAFPDRSLAISQSEQQYESGRMVGEEINAQYLFDEEKWRSPNYVEKVLTSLLDEYPARKSRIVLPQTKFTLVEGKK